MTWRRVEEVDGQTVLYAHISRFEVPCDDEHDAPPCLTCGAAL